jgi:AraC-like DNA-binding protein
VDPFFVPRRNSFGSNRRLARYFRTLKRAARVRQSVQQNYWRRVIIEAFTSPILSAVPTEIAHIAAPLRVVREVERFVDERGEYPAHISEICAALRVTRRTLHRAFHDILGIGPIAYGHGSPMSLQSLGSPRWAALRVTM